MSNKLIHTINSWTKGIQYVICYSNQFQILTKDSVTISVDAVIYYKVSDAMVSVANVENAHHSTRLLAQTTLRNVLGTKRLSEILSERDVISNSMQVSKAYFVNLLLLHNGPTSLPVHSSFAAYCKRGQLCARLDCFPIRWFLAPFISHCSSNEIRTPRLHGAYYQPKRALWHYFTRFGNRSYMHTHLAVTYSQSICTCF